jgi:hypothetical protein
MFVALIAVSVACLLVALILAGAGHGWGSAFIVSLTGLVASPVAGVAWAKRRRLTGKRIALVLVALAVGANLVLVHLTRAEGPYFESEWLSDPEMVVIWAALWAVWQVVAVFALFWPGTSGWQDE